MLIRKLFKFCSGHVVRNATTKRCSQSIHGHNFIVEVLLEGNSLDNGQMILDFGLLKDEVKEFFESFDHSYLMWNKESEEFKQFIKKFSKRWVELPVSPSAESLSLLFLAIVNQILMNSEFNNGENFTLHSVIVHETDTGYAQSFRKEDEEQMYDLDWEDVIFSSGVQEEWKNNLWWGDLLSGKKFIKLKPTQQIK